MKGGVSGIEQPFDRGRRVPVGFDSCDAGRDRHRSVLRARLIRDVSKKALTKMLC
jgi:hypothetical protein